MDQLVKKSVHYHQKYKDKNRRQIINNVFKKDKNPNRKILSKKRIQKLQNPQLIIKINLDHHPKLTIPIFNITEQGFNQIIITHITKFYKQTLKNHDFDTNSIQGWKTINPQNILKDYYIQTGKSLHCFKGSILEVKPILKEIKKTQIKLSDFQIIKCIGTGGFSRVFLSRYKPNGKFFALKLMEKQGLLQSGKQCVVTNQRDIMVELDNPQILKLQFAFETKHFVVLGLQYCPGGQLFYYLRKIKRMNQQQARYCFVQILMGIQYLHSKKIIYRDIKPQNIMIDLNGNLKIADFGLSRKGIRTSQLAYTFCGSPEYMAPQMLSKTGHTFSVDYYCLGALLYELVTGSPPYYSRDVDKIYYSIQNNEIEFPQYVQLSPQIKMLLQGLLIKDPKKRLGSLGGIRQILGHPWVRKIKPIQITNKTILTPIKIDLLIYNINEDEIEQIQNNFMNKLKDEDNNYEQIFQNFYFNRYQNINVLDQPLPSVKSDSTKQNKSFNQKLILNNNKQKNYKFYQKFKDKQLSKQYQKNNIPLVLDKSKQSIVLKVNSQKRKIHEKKLKHLKKQKQKNIDLIIRGRKRDGKSNGKKQIKINKIYSPKFHQNNNKMLKRIKSSQTLNSKFIK